MVDKVIKFMLLTSPLIYTSWMTPGRFEMILFYAYAFLLFLASLLDKPKRESALVSRGIFCFLLFCFINSAIHSFPTQSIATLLNLTVFCVVLNTVFRYMRPPEKYYRYIRISAIFSIVVYLAQRYWFNFLPFTAYSLGGTFGSIQRFANYIALIIPITFAALWFILPVIAVMSLSMNPICIYFMMLLSQIKKIPLYRFTKIAMFLSASSIIIYLMRSKIMTSIMFRINSFISPTINSISHNLLIGKGLGSYYANVGNDPYNSIIAFVYDVGIFGLVLVGYGFFKIRKYFDWSIRSLSFVGLILVSMVDYPLEISRLWPTIAFIIAAFFIKPKEETC